MTVFLKRALDEAENTLGFEAGGGEKKAGLGHGLILQLCEAFDLFKGCIWILAISNRAVKLSFGIQQKYDR